MAGSSTFPVTSYDFPKFALPAGFRFASGKAGALQKELAEELKALNTAASAHRTAVGVKDALPEKANSSPFEKAVRETAATLRLVRGSVVGLMKGVHLAGAPIIDADSSVDEYTAGVLKQPLCRLAALEAARAFDVILDDAGLALNRARWNAADATEAASEANAVVKEKDDALQAALSNLAKARLEKEKAEKAKSIAISDAASALRKTETAKEAVRVAEANYASAMEKAAFHEAARERQAGKRREDPPAARCRTWQPKRPRKDS